MGFKNLNQAYSTMCSNFDTASSKLSMFEIVDVSTFEKDATISLINLVSSSLFLTIDHLLNFIRSSTMGMVTIKRAWSDKRCQSERIQ